MRSIAFKQWEGIPTESVRLRLLLMAGHWRAAARTRQPVFGHSREVSAYGLFRLLPARQPRLLFPPTVCGALLIVRRPGLSQPAMKIRQFGYGMWKPESAYIS